MKKKIFYGMIALLSVSLFFLACDTGTNSESDTTISWPVEDESTSSGGGQDVTTPITDGTFALDSDEDLTPPGLVASAEVGVESGNVTVTLSSADTGVPTGLPADQAAGDFNPDWFGSATEVAKHDYFVFALKGLEGGTTNTRIKQTNGGFILYKDVPDLTPPPSVANGSICYYNGVHTKEKLYAAADFDPAGALDAEGVWRFDFNILIVKGKSPVKLEITPDDDPARKYTVTINYNGVTFVGGALPTGTTKEQYVKPTGDDGTTNYNSYAGGAAVSVSSVTKQVGLDNYTAKVASTGPIGGGPTSLPGGNTGVPYNDMAGDRWVDTNTALRTNVITFDFLTGSGEIFDGYSSGTITIKQVNPAFVVYEEYLKTSGTWNAEAGPDYTGYYQPDSALKWSAEGGHIVYKEKGGYTHDPGGLDKFSILVMDGVQPKEVIFTFTFTTGSGEVTRGLKIDYSDVKF